MYKTPILLITFNRPDHTRRVLTEILKQEPQSLYVCQDGAREGNDNDKIKCQEVRDVINELTSAYAMAHPDFSLFTLYSSLNLGCGPGPVAGITWFFENVEQGIIFEDDCLPHPDFFGYCGELLDRYKDDERIGFIGGCNYVKTNSESSYVFSGGHHQTWGWATWRRTWKHFDYALSAITKADFEKMLDEYCMSWRQKEYWWNIFEKVRLDQMNNSCWDYQFYFSCWKHHQLAVAPSVNLVSNTGFGADATHTQAQGDLLMKPASAILPLVHPSVIRLNKSQDLELMKRFVAPYDYGVKNVMQRGLFMINRYIKRKLNHHGPWFK